MGKQIQVFVKSINDKSYVISIDPEDTAQNLLKKAAEKTNSPLLDMRIVYAGKQISEQNLKMKVHELGIVANSTVFCIFRLKGGYQN